MTHRKVAPTLALLLALVMGSVAVVTVTFTPTEAHAQNARAKAKKAYRAAKKAYDSGDFPQAVELFKEAYSHEPRPELLFNIGQALREAGDFIAAADFLQRYLQEKPDAPNRDQVAQQVFELQQQIAAQAASVMVQGSEDGLEVFVNDEPEARCVTPCLLTLIPVTTSIKVTKEGLSPDIQEITPEAGQEMTVRFAPGQAAGAAGKVAFIGNLDRGKLLLDGAQYATFPMAGPLDLEVGVYPAAIEVGSEVVWQGTLNIVEGQTTELNVVVVKTEAPAVEVSSGPSALGITGLTLTGLGVASLGAGMFFGLAASEIETDLQGQLDKGTVPNSDLIDQGETQALYANIFYTTGIIALGTGITLYLLDDGGSEAAPEEASLQLLVSPQSGGGVVGIGGHY